MPPVPPDLADRLSSYLTGQLGRTARVENLDILVGGASREMYRFDLDSRTLVLRRDPPGMVWEPGARIAEFEAMKAAASVGVPVAEPLFVSEDAILDSPFVVMGLVEGETIPRRLLRDEPFSAVRPRLAREWGAIMARLHTAPIPAGVRRPGDGESGTASELRQLELRLDMLAEISGRYPILEFGIRWLRKHEPAATPLRLVHGDFRMGNVMVGPDGTRAVLDWEIVHAGDPLQDLGWVCTRAWRFGNDDLPVGGVGSYDDLCDGYEQVSGSPVDRTRLHWWEVFGSCWWGAGCAAQASRFLIGLVPNIELAALGRRTAEQEHDLMELIGQGGLGGHGRPRGDRTPQLRQATGSQSPRPSTP